MPLVLLVIIFKLRGYFVVMAKNYATCMKLMKCVFIAWCRNSIWSVDTVIFIPSQTSFIKGRFFVADLFYSIATQKKKVGTIAPKKFIQRLRKENGM